MHRTVETKFHRFAMMKKNSQTFCFRLRSGGSTWDKPEFVPMIHWITPSTSRDCHALQLRQPTGSACAGRVCWCTSLNYLWTSETFSLPAWKHDPHLRGPRLVGPLPIYLLRWKTNGVALVNWSRGWRAPYWALRPPVSCPYAACPIQSFPRSEAPMFDQYAVHLLPNR